MRICMLAYTVYESDSRVMHYAECLVGRGDEVDVICLKRAGQPDFTTIRGVNVYRIQERILDEKGELSYLSKLIKFLFKSTAFLTHQHLKKRYDLVHAHSVPDFEVFAALFAKMFGSKIILDIHDLVPEFYMSKFDKDKKSLFYKALKLAERISIGFSTHVIISNHIWKETLISRSVNGEKCSVLINYPDQRIFYKAPRKNTNEKFIIIYPGSLNWHQGVDIAIRAFSKIKEKVPEAEFHIYGNGMWKTALMGLIKDLKLEDRIFLKGTLPINEIAGLMRNAELGVVPKRNDPFGGEAFSTKILEFMSLGVPVIVAETKIDRYYFNDSVVKFFEPDNVNSLSESMLEMIRNSSLRETLAANALKFVEDFYWEKRKHEYLDLVDRLIGKES